MVVGVFRTDWSDRPLSSSAGILEIKSVDVGVVAIRSLSSNFYLAISWKGEVYGSVRAPRTLTLTLQPHSQAASTMRHSAPLP